MARLTAYERLQLIHDKERPTIRDYIPMIFDEYYEMHGDRLYSDDPAITGGIGVFQSTPVTVIAHVRGRNLEENKKSNFAMAHPEGYRKALRLIRQAEKFHREAIARNLYELINVRTPIVSVVLGEGGSGGALALGVCDELAMMENALYSVISPRGCASILWKDASREKEAANILHITAEDLVELSVAEHIISEPAGGSQKDPVASASNISEYLADVLPRLLQEPLDILLEKRYDKFRKIGTFSE